MDQGKHEGYGYTRGYLLQEERARCFETAGREERLACRSEREIKLSLLCSTLPLVFSALLCLWSDLP